MTPQDLDAAVAFWRAADVASLQEELRRAQEAAENARAASTDSRRELAEATRSFKALDRAEQTRSTFRLVQRYQREVDALTDRATNAEKFLFEACKRLARAPDPAVALARAAEDAAVLRRRANGTPESSELAQLRRKCQKMERELAEWEEESKSIKNQGHVIRKLEERVALLERELEERDREAAERDAAGEAGGREAEEALRRVAEAEAEAAQCRARVQELRAAVAMAEAEAMRARQERDAVEAARAHAAEVEAAALEEAERRLRLAEAANEDLRARLAAAGTSGPSGSVATGSSAAAAELAAATEARRRLEAELQAERGRAAMAEAQLREADAKCASRVADLEDRCARMAEELARSAGPDEVARLRGRVRELEGTVRAHLGGAGSEESGEEGQGEGAGVHVERLLAEKCRRLESALTQVREELAQAQERAQRAEGAAKSAEARNASLSRELASAHAELEAAQRALAETVGATGPGNEGAGALSPAPPSPTPLTSPAPPGSDALVAALSGQRDRLRRRVGQLEAAEAHLQAEVHRLTGEAEELRRENVALVERMRFVEQYGRGRRQGPGSLRGDLESGAAPDAVAVVHKYARQLDSSIDPFQEFRSKLRRQKLTQLGVPDRTLHRIGLLIVDSAPVRLFAFGYLVVLHLIVTVVLLRLSGGILWHIHTNDWHSLHRDEIGSQFERTQPTQGATLCLSI